MGGVNLDLLIKVISAGLPHCKGIISPFVINKYYGEDILRLYLPFLLKLSPTNLAFTGRS